VAADQGVTERIDLDNFTPGIFSSYAANGGAQPAPDGAAQETDTYGCYGHPSGGLHPFPRVVATNTKAITTPITEPTYYPTGLARWCILDTQIVSPVVPYEGDETTDFAYSGVPDFMFYAFESYYDSGGASSYDRVMSVRGFRYFQATPTEVIVDSTTYTTTVHSSRRLFGYGSLDQGATTVTGDGDVLPVLLYMLNPVIESSMVIGCYPNVPDGTPETDSQKDAPGTWGRQVALLSHQGRLVSVAKTRYSSGTSVYGPAVGADAEMIIADDVFFKAAKDVLGTGTGTLPAQYGLESMNGWGTWCSYNAQDLFVVKQVGGGVKITGDIANPTVTRLPGIPSTHLAVNRGALTEKGYVYGTREGVWRWNGGDEAELLSAQLEGWFWDVDSSTRFPDAMKGKFGYLYPFLFAPNNWVLDTRSGGWFRLTDPASIQYAFYDVSAGGHFYASPGFITATDPTLNHRYSMEEFAEEFSWRSQPIARTRNRRLTFREVSLVAQGTGTVTVDVIGLVGEFSVTFTLDSSDRPHIQTLPVSQAAHDVEVRITSTGEPDGTAPTVYRVSLGYQPDHTAK
jgi:hypothetical protein